MRNALYAVLLASASTLFAGCAVQSGDVSDGPIDESEDAIGVSALYGTWTGGNTIYSITFTRDYAETFGGGLRGRRFDATIDTGLRCVTAPCDGATMEVSGVYKLTKGSTLTLASYDRPTLEFSKILGDYTVKSSKTSLFIGKKDGTLKETFTKAKPSTGGVKCGDVVCGEGLVCCNPLRNICTKPDMMCIQ